MQSPNICTKGGLWYCCLHSLITLASQLLLCCGNPASCTSSQWYMHRHRARQSFKRNLMVWATSLHFSTFWRKKNLDCLEPACLISPELLKLKIQLTCTASGLRILNRHSKGHQAIWKPHLIDHMVLPPHFFPCGNGRQYAFKLTTDHRINQTTLLVLLFQVSKCCHHSGISNCGCKGGEVGGRTVRCVH